MNFLTKNNQNHSECAGEALTLKVDGSDTVRDVKNKIQEMSGFPPEEQEITFCTVLEDSGFIGASMYNIQNQATLHLRIRDRNGSMQMFVKTLQGEDLRGSVIIKKKIICNDFINFFVVSPALAKDT